MFSPSRLQLTVHLVVLLSKSVIAASNYINIQYIPLDQILTTECDLGKFSIENWLYQLTCGVHHDQSSSFTLIAPRKHHPKLTLNRIDIDHWVLAQKFIYGAKHCYTLRPINLGLGALRVSIFPPLFCM